MTTTSPAIAADHIVARADGLMTASIEGETVMFSADKGKYFSLGEVGSKVWDKLEQPTRIDALCAQLQRQFNATPSRLKADVLEFVGELRDAGLVSVSTDT